MNLSPILNLVHALRSLMLAIFSTKTRHDRSFMFDSSQVSLIVLGHDQHAFFIRTVERGSFGYYVKLRGQDPLFHKLGLLVQGLEPFVNLPPLLPIVHSSVFPNNAQRTVEVTENSITSNGHG